MILGLSRGDYKKLQLEKDKRIKSIKRSIELPAIRNSNTVRPLGPIKTNCLFCYWILHPVIISPPKDHACLRVFLLFPCRSVSLFHRVGSPRTCANGKQKSDAGLMLLLLGCWSKLLSVKGFPWSSVPPATPMSEKTYSISLPI